MTRVEARPEEAGEPFPIDEDTWCVPLEIVGGTMHYTLSYLLRGSEGDLHIVDPGEDTPSNREVVERAAQLAGGSSHNIRTITATHLHFDHLQQANHLREASGAVVLLHEVETHFDWVAELSASERLRGWGAPENRWAEMQTVQNRPTVSFPVDGRLEDGDYLAISGRRVCVIWTPGHTRGHICLRDEDRGYLFTGDHVLPASYPGVGLGGLEGPNPVTEYLASLDRVESFTNDRVLPGHQYLFTDLPARVSKTRARQLGRSREVAEAFAQGLDLTVWEMSKLLSWSGGWDSMSGFRLLFGLAQTSMHLDRIR